MTVEPPTRSISSFEKAPVANTPPGSRLIRCGQPVPCGRERREDGWSLDGRVLPVHCHSSRPIEQLGEAPARAAACANTRPACRQSFLR